jgi:hypothetical protein
MGVSTGHISRDKKYNSQKNKRTNNDLQNTTQKIKE